MNSAGVLLFVNLPVGFPDPKSLPYGAKLALIKVFRLLLAPWSTIESPNIINAGTLTFFGRVTRARPWSPRQTMEIKKTVRENLVKGNRRNLIGCILYYDWQVRGKETMTQNKNRM